MVYNVVMCAETSKFQDFDSSYDSLLIATVVTLAVVIVPNCFVLALHRYIQRINREGKISMIQILKFLSVTTPR